MKCNGLASERGFTLIETLASLAVFALAAGAIGNLLVTQIRLETSNAIATTATSLAAKELEDLRSLDYGSIPGLSDEHHGCGWLDVYGGQHGRLRYPWSADGEHHHDR